jgi:phage-related protein
MAEVGEVKYKVTADDSGLDEQISKSESKLKSGFGKAAGAVGAAASAAVAAGATAMVSITKQAVDSYADYQQLIGGVETLFGDAAKTVAKNADEAYKNAGMSANDYMETVTGFSASLIQSLGGDTAKAAELADQAIIDMADNANKMGSDLSSIQTAYQGFAKQNYTMLDNLKLGYGGTKEEMERLLEDAGKIAGTKFDIKSYADVTQAIHVMQESMGIANATAEEAATTISGSMSAMQASWQNVLASFGTGDTEKISKAVAEMVENVKTVAGNLIPVIGQVISGISQMIAELAPVLAKELPGMIEEALPPLLDAAVDVIETLAKGLLEAIPVLMPTVTKLIIDLANMIVSLAPTIIETGIQLIVDLATGLAQALPELIPAVIDAVMTIVTTLLDNIDLLLDAAIQLIIALAEGLIAAQDKLIEKAPALIWSLVKALIKAAPQLLQAALELILTLVRGLVQNFGKLVSTGQQVVEQVRDGFWRKVQDAKNWGRDLLSNFIGGIREKWDSLVSTVRDVAGTVRDYLGFSEPEKGPLSNFHTFAPDMMDLYAKGIDDNIDKVESSVEDVSRTVAGSFTADVGYNLPDIAGYAADLSAAITAQASTEIVVPISIDGREVARATAWYTNEQLAWEAR